jgi:predicted transcriptional regulator
MASHQPIQGELQEQIMRALWRLGRGRVGEVREALPERYRSAYTTVQTILNRLAERGLLGREREGNAIVYKPRVSEAEYLSGSLSRALTGISGEAKLAAIAHLVGGLDQKEQREIQAMAQEIAKRRGKR